MPPKRKPSKKSKKSKRASTKRSKRSTKKSKSKRSSKSKPKPRRKSNFRNKKLKLKKGETLPVYEPMTPQQRAQALIRVQKGDYLMESHPRFIRSEGKTGKIIKNPRYENSLAHLLGWTPANEDLDVMMDEQGADRPGYEPEPDAKRVPAALREKYEAEGITPKQRADIERKRREKEEERKRKERELDLADMNLGDRFRPLRWATNDRLNSLQDLSDAQIRTMWAEFQSDLRQLADLRSQIEQLPHREMDSNLISQILANLWSQDINRGLDALRNLTNGPLE